MDRHSIEREALKPIALVLLPFLRAMRFLGLDFNGDMYLKANKIEDTYGKMSFSTESVRKRGLMKTNINIVSPCSDTRDNACDSERIQTCASLEASEQTPNVEFKVSNCISVERSLNIISLFARRSYMLFILLVLWLSSTRFVLSIVFQDDSYLSVQISFYTWLMQVAVDRSVAFRLNFCEWLPNAFRLLDAFRQEAMQIGLDMKGTQLKVTKCVLVLKWSCNVLICFPFFVVPLLVYCSAEGKELVKATVLYPFETKIEFVLLGTLALMFAVASWALIIAFIVLMTFCLNVYFTELSDVMTRQFLSNEEEFCLHLQAHRLLYLQLAYISEVLDQYLSKWLAVSTLANTIFNIFTVYILVTSKYKSDAIVIFLACWMFLTLAGYSATLISCCTVSAKAKSPLFTLLKVRSATKNPEQAAELSVFLQAVIHGNVGITVMGLFNITKESILTIFGVVVSYFFVIIQFNFK